MAEVWEKQLYQIINRKPMLGVCEENKNEIWLKYFAFKGSILEACRRTVKLRIEANFTTKILYSIKVIVQ